MDESKIKVMVALHRTGHMSSWAVQKLLSKEERNLYTKLLTESINQSHAKENENV